MNTLVATNELNVIPSLKWQITSQKQPNKLEDSRTEALVTKEINGFVEVCSTESIRATVLKKEAKETYFKISLVVNMLLINIALLRVTNYAFPLLFLTGATLLKFLAHITTVKILLRRERNVPTI